MQEKRPSNRSIWILLVALGCVAAVAVWQIPNGNWDWPLLAVLLLFGATSECTAVRIQSGLKISGGYVALVLAMVFLYGTPAALIGFGMMSAVWLRERNPRRFLLQNLLTFSTFPLLGGIAVHEIQNATGVATNDPGFYGLVLGVFVGGLMANLVLIASTDLLMGDTFWETIRGARPVISSELFAAIMALGLVYIYNQVGLVGIPMAAVVILVVQHLLGQMILSQIRAEKLEARTKKLVSFQVGMLSALMRTLDLRDEMTARHCASVARYCRAIAVEAGLPKEDQELVHLAGLLHDIGKFILPDKILKANEKLNDDDWNLIRMHPAQGAKVVGSVEGYGPVADIIMAHHERIDGKGYPRRLKGEEIPQLSKIISVADTYDVMTARDSYRDPVSSFEAIQELRRVSGSQLDPHFVDVFVEKVLEGKDLGYRHGVDANFDFELALEERIAAVERGGGFLIGIDTDIDSHGLNPSRPKKKQAGEKPDAKVGA